MTQAMPPPAVLSAFERDLSRALRRPAARSHGPAERRAVALARASRPRSHRTTVTAEDRPARRPATVAGPGAPAPGAARRGRGRPRRNGPARRRGIQAGICLWNRSVSWMKCRQPQETQTSAAKCLPQPSQEHKPMTVMCIAQSP